MLYNKPKTGKTVDNYQKRAYYERKIERRKSYAL